MHDWQLPDSYSSPLGEVRWAELGDPAGEPVVLLHGTPFSSYIWRHIAVALGQRHRVFVWDMPGYGQSARAAGQDLSLDALTAVFAGLLDHWRLDEPLVVAHDSGGALALGATLLHGCRYRRLALVDAVSLGPWGSPFFQLVGAQAELFDGLPPTLHQALLREYVNTASHPGLHPATLDALNAPWTDEPGQAAFYRQLTQRAADDAFVAKIEPSYPEITIPVRICWGENDTWIPVARGQELARRISTATFHPIPHAGHLAQEDNPAHLTAAILPFLQENDEVRVV